jgi:hypothetical protein
MKKLSSFAVVAVTLTSAIAVAKPFAPPSPAAQFAPSGYCLLGQPGCLGEFSPGIRIGAKGVTTGITAQTWRIRGWVDDTPAQKYSVIVGSDQFTNAYQGDTDTSADLPMLCISKQNLGTPSWHVIVSTPSSAYEGNFHEHTTPGGATRNTWSGARGFWSTPVTGLQLTSRAVANAICEQQAIAYGFTGTYRMAEFHDGDGSAGRWPGWGYWLDMTEAKLLGLPMYQFPYDPTYSYPYGAVQRFWIATDDQPSNPWN